MNIKVKNQYEQSLSISFQRAKYDAGGMGYAADLYALFLNPFRNEKSKLISVILMWTKQHL